jgi:hypothetical protein
VVRTNRSKLEASVLLIIVLAVTTFVIANGLEASLTANNAYGQTKPSPPLSSTTATHKTTTPKLHAIRINSPTKGQTVPVHKDIAISGISTTPNGTSNCHVSVIVNGIKPYQNATGNGPKGPNDYSKWTFLLVPKYTSIKQGVNKITSKFSCGNNPSLLSYYSVNVTGAAGSGASVSKTPAPITTTNNTPPAPGIITPH